MGKRRKMVTGRINTVKKERDIIIETDGGVLAIDTLIEENGSFEEELMNRERKYGMANRRRKD